MCLSPSVILNAGLKLVTNMYDALWALCDSCECWYAHYSASSAFPISISISCLFIFPHPSSRPPPPLPPALFRATSLNFPPIYNSLKRLHLHLAFPLSAAPGGVRGVSGGAALALASASKPLLSRDLKVLKLLREFVRVRVGVCACRSVRVCTYTRASLGSWVLSY